MQYELTSNYGWVCGSRALRSDGKEELIVLLHVDGTRTPVQVGKGDICWAVVEQLKASGATEFRYSGPGKK